MIRQLLLFLLVLGCFNTYSFIVIEGHVVEKNDSEHLLKQNKVDDTNKENKPFIDASTLKKVTQDKTVLNGTNSSNPLHNKQESPPTISSAVSKPSSENGIIATSDDEEPAPQLESGTVIRGICVMVALSFIFMVYLGIKNYSNKRNPKTGIIKKYGVRAQRNDVEMEPLPLSEDDDETVFDRGSLIKS